MDTAPRKFRRAASFVPGRKPGRRAGATVVVIVQEAGGFQGFLAEMEGPPSVPALDIKAGMAFLVEFFLRAGEVLRGAVIDLLAA